MSVFENVNGTAERRDFSGGGSSILSGLEDVNISSPQNNQILKFNSETNKWENGSGGGGSADDLSDLDDVSLSNLQNNQVLKYNSTSGKWENKADESGGMATDGSNSETLVTLNNSLAVSTYSVGYYILGSVSKAAGLGETITFTFDSALSDPNYTRFNNLINAVGVASYFYNNDKKGIIIKTLTTTTMTAVFEEDISDAINVSSGSQITFYFKAYAENRSTATGGGTLASGTESFANGYLAMATGTASHAEGSNTLAKNSCSHAEGIGSVAAGNFSHAEGYYTKTEHPYQHVTGYFNDNKSDTIFEVGNGGTDQTRSNAFEVTQDGYIRTKNGANKIAFNGNIENAGYYDASGAFHRFKGNDIGYSQIIPTPDPSPSAPAYFVHLYSSIVAGFYIFKRYYVIAAIPSSGYSVFPANTSGVLFSGSQDSIDIVYADSAAFPVSAGNDKYLSINLYAQGTGTPGTPGTISVTARSLVDLPGNSIYYFNVIEFNRNL